MFRLQLLGLAFLMLGTVSVTGHAPKPPGEAEMKRHIDVRDKCGHQVAQMKKARRSLRRRDLSTDNHSDETLYKIHALAPQHEFITNWTNILTPETSAGPYWLPRSQTLRQDIREKEPGVPLTLEIGVIDIETCQPARNVLVDIWHCNATGYYSSFTGLSPNTPFQEVLKEHIGNHTVPPDFHKGMPDLSWLQTDDTTFLRGVWPTNDEGVTSFTTIFPGFYVQRSIHIHTQVHTHWAIQSNGTVMNGRIVSTGQIFFDENLSSEIMGLEPYADHTQVMRIKNTEDGIFYDESKTGAMTIMDTEPLDGHDYANGIIGYITLGIQTSKIQNGSTIDPAPPIPTTTN